MTNALFILAVSFVQVRCYVISCVITMTPSGIRNQVRKSWPNENKLRLQFCCNHTALHNVQCKIHLRLCHTVSHFNYAPLFQGPYFLIKTLESNILYDNLLIDILSVCWHQKYIQNHSCETFCCVKGNFSYFDRNARATWTSIFSTCVLSLALSMVIVVTEKHKNDYFIQVKLLFRSLNLVTLLLFEEMLVLTSY